MTRVLFVAGSGRSGSTLVTNVLGQADGVLAAGELRYLWQRGAVEDRPCGCGQSFARCPMWTRVMKEVDADPAAVAAALRDRLRMRRLPALLWRRRVEPHPAVAALYAALGGDLVVDSSKLPPYGLLVDGLPGVEVRVLHLVRDPRATAFSWRRRRGLDGPGDARLMSRPPVAKAALLWLVWNATAALLWRRSGRYLRVRYEDFAADPAGVTRRIADFAGVPAVPFDAHTVHLAPTHAVAGNPSRHRTGPTPVVADDEWVRGLSRPAFALVTAITAPLLWRWRYPLRRAAAGPPAGAPTRATGGRG
ncbi:sulfotransferase [Phytohabitans sp. ZYX-F-186]|uniref:Sulfotransferase n=1 Tax=Phytohabitans maris TaxID=3071409 RepID=A0ABU0ZD58_9ACTN|nr:sulfotransferase [Phytohabitans sp. ZYX-F-186]MDQ7904995.1 sulfotransferase [Phytohabitans sp. ZYX-F-186]